MGCGGVKKRWTLPELFLSSKRYFRVNLSVKTCEVLCFAGIVRVRVYHADFFVFFVLHHWWVLQVLTPRTSHVSERVKPEESLNQMLKRMKRKVMKITRKQFCGKFN